MADTVVFIGNNPEDSSMYLVGKQIADRIPGAVMARTTSDKSLAHAKLVICIAWEWTSPLLKVKRFLHFDKLVTFLASNFEEESLPEKFQIIGLTLSGSLVVHSEHTRTQISTFALKYLNMSTVRLLASRLNTRLYGVESVFTLSPDTDKNNWIVPYNRINQTQKDLNLHQELTSKIASAISLGTGDKLDTLFIASTNLWTKVKPAEYPDYRFVEQPKNRDDYRVLIRDRGFFLCTSNYESFGIYYLELLLTGTIGLFVDKPWVRFQLPNYKHIYSAQDIPAAALMVYRDFEAQKQYIATEVAPWIRKTYDLDKFVQGLQSVASTEVAQ